LNDTEYQPDNLDLLQGYWKEGSDIESYAVVESNIWYSIVIINDKVIVKREYVGFVSNLESDSLAIFELNKNGTHLIFLSGEPNSTTTKYHRYKNFREYEYDLHMDYLIYYANQPVTYNRIKEIPEAVYKTFKEKKDQFVPPQTNN